MKWKETRKCNLDKNEYFPQLKNDYDHENP